VTVTRLELNDMIRPSVRQTTDALRRTIASAGLRAEDLSAVLLAGGSSRIPLVDQMVSREFGKPVRVTLHPKFTVALGAATVAARAETTPPPRATPPGGMARQQVLAPAAPTPLARKKWLVPTVAAVVVLVAALTTLFITTGGGNAGARTPTNTPSVDSKPSVLRVYDGEPVAPWTGLLASPEDNWTGTKIDAEGTRQTTVAAVPDEEKGLRVTWNGGAAQVYLQSTTGTQNLKSYMDNKGALVFDMTVYTPPAGLTTMAIHCVYPCGADVPVTSLFEGMPTESKSTVKIPLSCFTDGLDATKVNTPFLIYTDEPFDATFANIRWVPGAAADPDAVSCAALN
jgi:hypothetical protein